VIHTWHRAHCVAQEVPQGGARRGVAISGRREEARGALKRKKTNDESDVTCRRPKNKAARLLTSFKIQGALKEKN
jgi:hypothetical protein